MYMYRQMMMMLMIIYVYLVLSSLQSITSFKWLTRLCGRSSYSPYLTDEEIEVQRDKKFFDRYKATKGDTRDKISVLPDLELENWVLCYLNVISGAGRSYSWMDYFLCLLEEHHVELCLDGSFCFLSLANSSVPLKLTLGFWLIIAHCPQELISSPTPNL